MRVAIAGSTGLIGTALAESLTADGHTVTRLVRREVRAEGESSWDPLAGRVDTSVIAGSDVVVNLSGASIGGKRLTASYAKTVLESRLSTTGLLARTLAEAGRGTLIQASAGGYYGARGEEILHERSLPGTGLLPEIVVKWEQAANPAILAGVRVVLLRTGLVLAPNGPLAERLFPLIRLGLLRRLGSGKQWHSWISLLDVVRAIRLLSTSAYAGPVNLTAPTAVQDSELIAALARAAHRPRLFPVPSFALRIVAGPAAEDLLGSQVVEPAVLRELGFTWVHTDIDSAAVYAMTARGNPGASAS